MPATGKPLSAAAQGNVAQADDGYGGAVGVEFVEESLFCVGGHYQRKSLEVFR